jgi:hypothetical protein
MSIRYIPVLEINKDITECFTFVLYLHVDISLKLDANGKITTKLYDKGDDLNFVNFPYLCRKIAYGVYISELVRHTINF